MAATLARVRRMARMCMDVYEDGCPIPSGSFLPLLKTMRALKIVEVPDRFETEEQKYELLRLLVGEITRRLERSQSVVYDA